MYHTAKLRRATKSRTEEHAYNTGSKKDTEVAGMVSVKTPRNTQMSPSVHQKQQVPEPSRVITCNKHQKPSGTEPQKRTTRLNPKKKDVNRGAKHNPRNRPMNHQSQKSGP